MKSRYSFFFVFLFIAFSLNAQKTNKKTVSIYTVSSFSDNSNGFSAINKKLDLKDFNFVFVKGIDLELNQFSIDTKNVYNKPSAFVLDDYNRFQNKNLLKGFLLKNDPTRWNMQCVQHRL